jgi:hypothetical protein
MRGGSREAGSCASILEKEKKKSASGCASL